MSPFHSSGRKETCPANVGHSERPEPFESTGIFQLQKAGGGGERVTATQLNVGTEGGRERKGCLTSWLGSFESSRARRFRETKGIQACGWRKTTLTQQAGYFSCCSAFPKGIKCCLVNCWQSSDSTEQICLVIRLTLNLRLGPRPRNKSCPQQKKAGCFPNKNEGASKMQRKREGGGNVSFSFSFNATICENLSLIPS